MILPGSEAYIKTGLAKSAFHQTIYGGMPLDYYLPGIETSYRLVLLTNIRPKFYQIHDLYLAFYQPYEIAYTSLKQGNRAAPAWVAFMHGLVRHHKFLSLNALTQESMELAAAAAARLLTRLGTQLRYIEEINAAMKQAQKADFRMEREMTYLGKGVAAADLKEVEKELTHYLQYKREAELAAARLAGYTYTPEGISIWRYLQSPDEFRRRVWLLTSTAAVFRMFSRILPSSMDQQVVESFWGGVEGVTRMRQYWQLKEVLPSELAMAQIAPALFTAKLAQMNMMVYRRAASIKLVVFVDKSGSMVGEFDKDVAKISVAAGLALALHRKLGAAIYLFDTEVDKVSTRDVIETLMRIQADGGTNIAAVMEEIMNIDSPNHIYLIISDGITDAPQDLTLRFISRCGARTRLVLVPQSQEHYLWVQELRRRGNVVYAHNVVQFEKAVKRIFTRL